MTYDHKCCQPFTIISNKAITAITNPLQLAIYTFLASKPPNWKINTQQLATLFGKSRRTIQRALGGLMEAGYYQPDRGIYAPKKGLKSFTKVINKTVESFNHHDYKTIAIYVYLLSKPPTWKAQVTDLMKRFKICKKGAQKSLRVLGLAGLFNVEKKRGADGKIDKWESFVFKTPQEEIILKYKEREEVHEKRIGAPEIREVGDISPPGTLVSPIINNRSLSKNVFNNHDTKPPVDKTKPPSKQQRRVYDFSKHKKRKARLSIDMLSDTLTTDELYNFEKLVGIGWYEDHAIAAVQQHEPWVFGNILEKMKEGGTRITNPGAYVRQSLRNLEAPRMQACG